MELRGLLVCTLVGMVSSHLALAAPGQPAPAHPAPAHPAPAAAPAASCEAKIVSKEPGQFHSVDGKPLNKIVVPKSCKQFSIKVTHTGKHMSNLVVSKQAHMADVKKHAEKLNLTDPKKKHTPAKGDAAGKVVAAGTVTLGGDHPVATEDTLLLDTAPMQSGDIHAVYSTVPGTAQSATIEIK